jgi:Family of unknown function (DUF6962)
VAAVAGTILLARAAGRRPSVLLWAGGFAAVGAAAILGGTWHAFSPMLATPWADLLWKATIAAAGLAGCLLIAGAAFASVPRRKATRVAGFAVIKLAVFLGWALPGDAFDPVVFDSAATLAAILVLQIFSFATRRARSAPWVLGGVGVSLAAAAVEAFRPKLLPDPLGPDAVYHLVEIAGLVLFYRGGRLFDDVDVAAQPNTSG